MSSFIVTVEATRPAGLPDRCFYCKRLLGTTHDDDCGLIKRKVRVRMTVEYDVAVPADWGREQVEFHRNDGTWCADNALDELAAEAERNGCLCPNTRFEYLRDIGEPYLEER